MRLLHVDLLMLVAAATFLLTVSSIDVEELMQNLQKRFNSEILSSVQKVAETFTKQQDGQIKFHAKEDETTKWRSRSKNIPSIEKLSQKAPDVDALERYNVDTALRNEIVGMSTGGTPREAVVAHVLTHYPDLTSSQATDIVIQANLHASRRQPDSMDFKKAFKEQSVRSERFFEKQKRDLENKKAGK